MFHHLKYFNISWYSHNAVVATHVRCVYLNSVFTLTYKNDMWDCCSVCEWASQGSDVRRVYIWRSVWHRLFLGRALSSPAEINDLNKLPEKQLPQSF